MNHNKNTYAKISYGGWNRERHHRHDVSRFALFVSFVVDSFDFLFSVKPTQTTAF